MKLIDFTVSYKEDEGWGRHHYGIVEGFTEHNKFLEIHLPENKVVMVDKDIINEITFTIDESEDEEQPQLRLV